MIKLNTLRPFFFPALAAFALILSAHAMYPAFAEATSSGQTELVVDKEKNIVSIMIEGKEVGRFDKTGLHVVGDVDYSGGLTDTPPLWLNTPPAKDGETDAP